MEKNYEQKKQELSKRFESKKTNFINTLFSLTKDLQDDLNILGEQYKEFEASEAEETESKTKEATKEKESKKK